MLWVPWWHANEEGKSIKKIITIQSISTDDWVPWWHANEEGKSIKKIRTIQSISTDDWVPWWHANEGGKSIKYSTVTHRSLRWFRNSRRNKSAASMFCNTSLNHRADGIRVIFKCSLWVNVRWWHHYCKQFNLFMGKGKHIVKQWKQYKQVIIPFI